MKNVFFNLGKYHIGGVCDGEGHVFSTREQGGSSIPKSNAIKIDMDEVAKVKSDMQKRINEFSKSNAIKIDMDEVAKVKSDMQKRINEFSK